MSMNQNSTDQTLHSIDIIIQDQIHSANIKILYL